MTTKPQNAGNPRRRQRAAAWIAFAGSGLLILFWSLYFTGVLGVDEGDAVLDPFLGWGSTLVAAARTGRPARP